MKRKNYEIRVANDRDLLWIRHADYIQNQETLEEKIRKREILVCDDNGQITGILRYMWFWDYIPFINFIWVEEGFREEGRARGMITKLEDETKGQNYKTIMTSTQSDENAQQFFRKVGFQDAGGFSIAGQKALELILIKYL
jgi:N-acetylglutamate synthase-like GNAT family acetyltransferase